MKKTKVIGVLAGITALAIGAGATYAWFTSTADPTSLVVDTATIAIASGEMDAELTNKLPGEDIGFEAWEFINSSTRESVVKFSLSALDIAYKDGEEFDDADRKELLLDMLNDPKNLVITGIETDASGTNLVYTDPNTGYMYIWLDKNEQLKDGEFSITMTIPAELGGNVGVYPTAPPAGAVSRSLDHPEEHEAIVTLSCQAYAVQGTSLAVTDIFGTDVADFFFK